MKKDRLSCGVELIEYLSLVSETPKRAGGLSQYKVMVVKAPIRCPQPYYKSKKQKEQFPTLVPTIIFFPMLPRFVFYPK